MDITALRAEIVNDPSTVGYKIGLEWQSDSHIAGMLNKPSTGIQINRGLVQAYEIVNEIDWGEAVAARVQDVGRVISAGQVDVGNPRVIRTFRAAFGSTSGTRTRLTSVVTRNGSRAEQVSFGSVRHQDVASARRST